MSLAIVAVGIYAAESAVDFTPQVMKTLSFVDKSILFIFVVDYAVRLATAPMKGAFIRTHVPELVAILPFSSAFRVARLVRLTRLTRLTRVITRLPRFVRVLSLGRVALKKVGKFLQTNGLIYMIYLTVSIVLVGACAIYFIEDEMMSFADALWWSFVTATTVGYGDISPSTGLGRIVAVVLMLTGIGLIGMVTGTVATYFLSKESASPKSTRESILEEIKGSLDRFAELTQDDLDAICLTLRALHIEQSPEPTVGAHPDQD